MNGGRSVILGLRDGHRSGDIFVPGSRRFADPSTYLYTPEQWRPKQAAFCALVGRPATAADALAQGRRSCTPRWRSWRRSWPARRGAVRLDGDDNLVIPKLAAEDVLPRPGS